MSGLCGKELKRTLVFCLIVCISYPSDDHVILTANDFNGYIPNELVVRSFTKDLVESGNSEVVRLPQVLIKEITVGAAKTIATEAVKKVTKNIYMMYTPSCKQSP